MIKVNTEKLSHNFLLKENAINIVSQDWLLFINAFKSYNLLSSLIACLFVFILGASSNYYILICQALIGFFISSSICGFLWVGVYGFFIKKLKLVECTYNDIYSYDKYAFKYCILRFLKNLIIYLSFIFLIIPGVYFSLTYALVPMIVADNPEISIKDAFIESCEMMCGHRIKLLKLYLSFIGWYFLGIVTLGIAFLWLRPYIIATEVEFYNDILNNMNRE